MSTKTDKRRQEYEHYLQSSKWKAIRKIKLAQAKKRCEKCSSTKQLHVHHLTYVRFKRERLSDLQVLCLRCHWEVHSYKSVLPPPELPSVTYVRRKRQKKRKPAPPPTKKKSPLSGKKLGLIAENERLHQHKLRVEETRLQKKDLETWK